MTPTPDYAQSVNRAIDYIVQHLAEPLRIEDLARVAAFLELASFHFHPAPHRIRGAFAGGLVRTQVALAYKAILTKARWAEAAAYGGL